MGAACKLRLWDSVNDRIARTYNISQSVIANQNIPYKILELQYGGELSENETEISLPENVCDLSSSPAKVWVVSSSADDTDSATKNVRNITLVGLNSDNEYTTEVVAMSGITHVQTTTTWKYIFHAYASLWGSGGSIAAGTIIIVNDDQSTTTYLTIATGANESDGSRIYIPSGYAIMLLAANSQFITVTNALYTGVVKASLYNFNGSGASPVFDKLLMNLTHYASGIVIYPELTHFVSDSNNAYIKFSEYYEGGGPETMSTKAVFLIYDANAR